MIKLDRDREGKGWETLGYRPRTMAGRCKILKLNGNGEGGASVNLYLPNRRFSDLYEVS